MRPKPKAQAQAQEGQSPKSPSPSHEGQGQALKYSCIVLGGVIVEKGHTSHVTCFWWEFQMSLFEISHLFFSTLGYK